MGCGPRDRGAGRAVRDAGRWPPAKERFSSELPAVDPTPAPPNSFIGTQELRAVVDDQRCNDTMSGESFDENVAVTFEGATMYGCGGAPAVAARVGLP